jgi:short-subunit dehydrogenase
MKAVVTGATSGIGLELTRILCAERKATVLGVGRSVDKLSELESAYGGCFVPVKADLSSPEGVEIVASAFTRSFSSTAMRRFTR